MTPSPIFIKSRQGSHLVRATDALELIFPIVPNLNIRIQSFERYTFLLNYTISEGVCVQHSSGLSITRSNAKNLPIALFSGESQ